MLLNVFKDIGLAVNTRKIKCVEVGPHRGIMKNEHFTVISNSYEK